MKKTKTYRIWRKGEHIGIVIETSILKAAEKFAEGKVTRRMVHFEHPSRYQGTFYVFGSVSVPDFVVTLD